MARGKSVKFKRKSKNMRPNAKIEKAKQTPDLIAPVEINASEPASNSAGGVSLGEEKKTDKQKRLSGLIFMCNSNTKAECYQYRVFGLPKGKKEVVEKIRPGMKLFLFDFQKKLLYGIYEATSVGKLNLEPAAFRGNFPAQVSFRIVKECLPLPETSLKKLIKENYEGSKFKQELSKKQVRKLSSSFRPLNASSSQLATQGMTNISVSRVVPPSAMENQLKHMVPLLPQGSYITERGYSHARTLIQPQTTLNVHFTQPGYHRTTAYTGHAQPTLHPQSLPATSTCFIPESQCPYVSEGASRVNHESHLRYRMNEERVRQDQPTSMPLQRESLYQDNRMVSYNSYAAPPPSAHASLVVQPQGSQPSQGISFQAYNSYMGPPAQYASSAMHQQVPDPRISQHTAPVSSYYSYAGVNRTIR